MQLDRKRFSQRFMLKIQENQPCLPLTANQILFNGHSRGNYRDYTTGREFRPGSSFGGINTVRQRHSHSPLRERFGFTEQAQVTLRDTQGLINSHESDSLFFQSAVDYSTGARRSQCGIHRKPDYSARVQLELVLNLTAYGYHAGIVRSRADLTKPYFVTSDK